MRFKTLIYVLPDRPSSNPYHLLSIVHLDVIHSLHIDCDATIYVSPSSIDVMATALHGKTREPWRMVVDDVLSSYFEHC